MIQLQTELKALQQHPSVPVCTFDSLDGSGMSKDWEVGECEQEGVCY